MNKPAETASQLIDARIRDLSDWRGETLARVRDLIRAADPQIVEEWKWRGVPVLSECGAFFVAKCPGSFGIHKARIAHRSRG